MSASAFDALLPDFSLDEQPARGPVIPAFVPLVGAEDNSQAPFEGLVPGNAMGLLDDADAVGSFDDPDLLLGQDPAEPDAMLASAVEDELDRQWEETEQAQETLPDLPTEPVGETNAQIEDIHAAHAAEIAALTVDAIGEMESRIEHAIEKHLVSILGGLMSADHRNASIEAFTRQVTDLVKDDASIKLRISGPPRFLDALGERLGEPGDRYVLVPAEAIELEAIIDESILSTRFSEWHTALEQVLP